MRGRSITASSRLCGVAPVLVALWLFVTMVALLAPSRAAAQTEPVARAVFFYSPQCEHCRDLIRGPLPALLDRYGRSLQILSVDTGDAAGTKLFVSAVADYDVPAEERGVPAVVIGDRFLAGGTDISQQLPILVAQHLAEGGVDWPELPGLPRVLADSGSVTSSPSELLAITEPSDGVLDRLARDRWGNMLALIVLGGMLVALGWVVVRAVAVARAGGLPTGLGDRAANRRRSYGMLVLVVLGLGVAGYLTYVQASAANTLCGPLADCDVVQQSRYSRLFGELPVAYVGVAGYVLMAVAFGIGRVASGAVARAGRIALFLLALGGTFFSIYLTVLEPFVIGATCLWCLGSAVIVTLLLVLSARDLGLDRPRPAPAKRRAEPRQGRRRAARGKAGG
jgi:uncharacterized membrane protein